VATPRRPWAIAETPYPRKTFRLPKILSPEQVSRLIDAAPTVFYRILLMTSARAGLCARYRQLLTLYQPPNLRSLVVSLLHQGILRL
jgi:hypothetical protein